MKPLLLAIMLLMLSLKSFSQQTKTLPTLTKQDFLLKSKHQKTAAWVLLASGFGLTTIGTIATVPKAAEDIGYGITLLPNLIAGNVPTAPKNDYTVETVLMAGGLAAMLSSIPLFIAAAKNKRRGMSLSFKNESALQPLRGSFVTRSVPSLSLKLSL